MIIHIIVIGLFFTMLVVMGAIFGRVNRDTSDYFRGGQRGTWWLVGMSMLMAATSTRTFTANAGVAYEAGLTFIILYIGALPFVLPIDYFFMAPRFRRLRLTTTAEVVRERFDVLTEQFIAYLRVVTNLFFSAAFLWGMAIFVGTVFDFPVKTMIVVLGVVVVLYTVSGGSWAVMGTDFVQGIVMISMCIVLVALVLIEFGGLGGMFQAIREAGLLKDFALIKSTAYSEQSEVLDGHYTWHWAVTIIAVAIMWQLSMGNAERYFSVKDESHARKVVLMVAAMAVPLSFLYMIPNLASRLLYSEQVEALAETGLSNPAEGSYAVASIELLPLPLLSVMLIAMFAAGMSSLDTGMNRNAAMFIKNIMPPLLRVLGRAMPSEARQLWLSRVLSVVLGGLIILIALILASIEGKGMFQILLDVNAILSPPLVVPMFVGIFLPYGPKWGAAFSIAAGAVAGLVALGLELRETPWTWIEKTWWVTGVTAAAYFVAIPFGRWNSQAYRDQVQGFFKKMKTPVDFKTEVGEPNDTFQMIILGLFACVTGVFVLGLLIVPSDPGNAGRDKLAILAVAALIFTVGLPLTWLGLRRRRAALNEAP